MKPPVGNDLRDVSFDLSPDGKRIVFTAMGQGGRDLYLLDLATKRVNILLATEGYEMDPRFSPDGRKIVFSARHPGHDMKAIWQVYCFELASKKLTRLTRDATAASFRPIWFPDGKRLLIHRSTRLRQRSTGGYDWYGSQVWVLEEATGRLSPTWAVRVISTHIVSSGKVFVSFIPSGAKYENYGFTSVEFLLQSKTPRLLPSKCKIEGEEVTWLPSGREMIFVGAGSSSYITEIWRCDPASGTVRPMTRFGWAIKNLRVSGDGRWVYFLREDDPFQGSKVSLWRWAFGSQRAELVVGSQLFETPLKP